MAEDYQAELDAVNAAILAILRTGQSYTLTTVSGSRSYNKASLGELRLLRAELEHRIDRGRSGGMRVSYAR